MAARRATSSGVAPKPARSMRCAARSPFHSLAAIGDRSSTQVAGPSASVTGTRARPQRNDQTGTNRRQQVIFFSCGGAPPPPPATPRLWLGAFGRGNYPRALLFTLGTLLDEKRDD